MRRVHIPIFLLAIAGVFICPGCGKIKGAQFPYVASPRVIVGTPASPAEGNIAISFQLMDREVEPADIIVEYSTNGGQTYNTATLTVPGEATNLASAWHPGKTHSIQWNSVTDMVGRSGAVNVCVKVTPSDASNPSGTAGVSGSFTVNNIAYNEPPTATPATPAGVQSGNVQINYFLADVESDTCTISVLYSTNDGTSWQAATMGAAGDGVSGLSSSPSGTAHVYLWDSRADNVALSGQLDTVRIRITPTDFNGGVAGDTNSFSVDNSVANNPPTVAITGGPADGSTVSTTQVTFTWSGNDTDGSVVGYYYSFDHDPPDVWTTDTTVISGALSEASHTFRVVAVDDDSDLSTVASRSFTVSVPGTITADFTASTNSGTVPLSVSFTDQSSATNGIDTWSWDFGNGDTSTAQHPDCIYTNPGNFTVSLTVTGPDGSDTETKTNYITVTSGPGGDAIYVDGENGNESRTGLSWAEAVRTIQTGIDKASDGWTVVVADGIYIGEKNTGLHFNGKEIHVKSAGSPNSCIIDCKGSGRGFYFVYSETRSATLEGFTVQNGDIWDHGAGIWCHGSSPVILNCIIRNNTAGIEGAGIYCNNSSPIIRNCTIIDNTAVSSPNGRGGGIFCTGSSAPLILNCTIANNSAGERGGGFFCRLNSSAVFADCTIANNHAGDSSGGGGVHFESASTFTLDNTVIWGNKCCDGDRNGNQIYALNGSTVTLNSCDVPDATQDPYRFDGTGTIIENSCVHADPLFYSGSPYDWRLQAGSACINAGDNSLVPPEVLTDLDGKARIQGGTVDIGAYEFGIRPPIADFSGTPLTGPVSLAVTFTDSSTSASGISGWLWDFGDGYTSSEQNPVHTYERADVYTVSLTVWGPDGWDTETKAGYVTAVSSGLYSIPCAYGIRRLMTDHTRDLIYGIDYDGGNFLVIDAQNHLMADVVSLGGMPYDLDITKDSSAAWVSLRDTAEAVEVDLSSLAVGKRIPIGGQGDMIACGRAGCLYIAKRDGDHDIAVVDTVNSTILRWFGGLCPDFMGLCTDSAGAVLYVTESDISSTDTLAYDVSNDAASPLIDSAPSCLYSTRFIFLSEGNDRLFYDRHWTETTNMQHDRGSIDEFIRAVTSDGTLMMGQNCVYHTDTFTPAMTIDGSEVMAVRTGDAELFAYR